MILIAISFITGIAAFNYFPFFPWTTVFLCIPAFLCLLIVPAIGGRRGFPILMICVFAFGFFYSSVRHSVLPELPLPKHDVVVEGTVAGSPAESGGKFAFTLDDNYMEGRKIEGKIRLYLTTVDDWSRVDERYFSPGDRVRALAKLRAPHVLRNPGVYSYDLKKEGIAASGYVKQVHLLNKGYGAMNRIYKMRQKLAWVMDHSLSAGSAALLKAIIPGFARDLSTETRASFSAAGLAHLLSISGTHFGLLAFIVFKIVKSTVKFLPGPFLLRLSLYSTPTQAAVVTTLPVLLMYALISGGSTPTIRSLVMVSVYMLALLLGRKDQWLNSLSIAASVILLWQPESLFQLSFLLSFLAVLSIGYALEKRKEREPGPDHGTQDTGMRMKIRGVAEKLKTAPIMTIAAVLGTTPLVAAVFNQFPLISPAANIIVTPIICFLILPLGFASGFCALVFNMTVMPLSGTIDAAAGFALRLITMFAEVPYSSIRVHNPTPALTVMYYGALMIFAGAENASRSRIKSIKMFLPFLLVVCLYLSGPYVSRGGFRVAFLDSGQGDASVVELPDGKIMVIDGSTVKPDMGRLAVAPYLWSAGIKKVDYMVVSHFHPDHHGGLIYLLDNFDVGEVWLSGRPTRDSAEFLQRVDDKKIIQKILSRGDVLETDRYRILAFHPYNEFDDASPRGEYSNQNNGSLVLKIETHGASVLFTGDIEKEAEENLRHLGGWLDSDVLKVPHHGSRTSSSEGFIKLVSPQIAVASAGRDNAFGHPHQDVVGRYSDSGTRFFRTDHDGAVILSFAGGKYKISTDSTRTLKKASGWRDEVRNLKLLLRIF